ncbi:MAG TPA: peptide MFS transporter [Vicinamibacterales bacterium]|nr:peptide MFS transporter [Vicinamibacterales bacterium]
MATAHARATVRVQQPSPQDRRFFGHPHGLSTLFFTEMWERFSYYGMRGFLILYMTAAVSIGGLGLDTATAAAVYGTYTSMVYLMSLPGGWIADRLMGQRRAVLYGGILIAAGHYTLAIPAVAAFYVGLTLIVLGTGLLKPNISVIVGQLYASDDDRRDAGFSIFYMGINLGAFMGPLITGYLAQSEGFRSWLAGAGLDPNSGWHWGFGAAGVGMTLGLLQYVLGARRLGDAGIDPVPPKTPQEGEQLKRRATLFIGGGLGLLVAFAVALASGALPFSPEQVTGAYSYLLLAVTIGFFAWLFLGGDWTPAERKRLYLIGVFFVAATLFWSVFEQAGSTLNFFADRNSNNVVAGQPFPSSWYQSLNALFIVIFAPMFAWLWVRLGPQQPASPTKFSIGLIGVGLGFLILVPAAQAAMNGTLVSPGWLFTAYLIHTWAELCLSPVGLSSMTKLAPARIVSLMMGVWFLAASAGNFLGGMAASFYEAMPLSRLFLAVAMLPIIAGIVMFMFKRPLTQLIGDRP